MTSRWDVVIKCDLREDTPEEVIRAISYLSGSDIQLAEKPQMVVEGLGNVWGSFDEPKRFLEPDIENEVFSSFQKRLRHTHRWENNREVYRYSLHYSCKGERDGYFYANIAPFIRWLPTYAVEGFIGYYKISDILTPTYQDFVIGDVGLWYAKNESLLTKWIKCDE